MIKIDFIDSKPFTEKLLEMKIEFNILDKFTVEVELEDLSEIENLITLFKFHSDGTEANELKSQLSNTDYKIIKCYEYNLAGLELPYDIEELHSERQDLRDQINELETV